VAVEVLMALMVLAAVLVVAPGTALHPLQSLLPPLLPQLLRTTRDCCGSPGGSPSRSCARSLPGLRRRAPTSSRVCCPTAWRTAPTTSRGPPRCSTSCSRR
jgi:hypothetical protein